MSKFTRGILIAAIALLALLVLGMLFGPRLLGANVKARLEKACAAALAMDVRIDGPLRLRFWPELRLTARDVHVGTQGAAIASAGEVQVGLELHSLLKRELGVRDIVMQRVSVAIVRERDGHFNIDRSSAASASSGIGLANVSIRNSSFDYLDVRSATVLHGHGCDLSVSRASLSAEAHADVARRLSFAAVMHCKELRTKDLAFSDVRLSLQAKNGVFNFDPLAYELFAGHGTGRMRASFSTASPSYEIHTALQGLRFQDVLQHIAHPRIGEGALDFSAALALHGSTAGGVARIASGEASLRAQNLILNIGDLDAQFSRYESTQNFNLVDVGAFLLAGPLGIAATKGYDYARIFNGKGGSTSVTTLLSHWRVEAGIAYAQDVAMTTAHNRVALQGGLDFVNDRFDNMIVALVDDKGCARVEQKISGAFAQPVIEKPNVLTTIVGPARGLINKGRALLGAKCTVFYAGAVPAPH